ncbi:substrate-binding periplasmic protein [Shewanella waksmanii]|uniref:substrate-binding periplasmic protein n=1 Tax=Shewanella waksmanii TaxID=213783 RepID=UPI00048C449C|nr:transporter substrate-binding domain-containing protein [Shewanella waksmanii]
MYKRLVVFLLLFAPLSIAAKPLTYLVIAQQAEPFQIVHSQTDAIEYSGIITDIVNHLAKHYLKQQLRTEHAPFLRYIRSMNEKQMQPWISYGSPVWAQHQAVAIQNTHLVATPLFTVHHQLLTRSADPFHYQRIDDLFGETVILLKGYSYPGLQQYIDSGQIKAFAVNSHQSALNALLNNRGKGFVSMGIRSHYTIERYGFNKRLFAFNDFSDTIKPNNIHISHNEKMPQRLINQLNHGIINMHQEHKIAEIISRYTVATSPAPRL